MGDIKKWDNDIHKFDVTKASRAINPWLENYGMDRFSYKPEMTYSSTVYYANNEGRRAHGYPMTAYL